jgi:hypothetical protein
MEFILYSSLLAIIQRLTDGSWALARTEGSLQREVGSVRAAAYQRSHNHIFGYDLHASAIERSNTMATEQERARKDIESSLAQDVALDGGFRRHTLRTRKEVVC